MEAISASARTQCTTSALFGKGYSWFDGRPFTGPLPRLSRLSGAVLGPLWALYGPSMGPLWALKGDLSGPSGSSAGPLWASSVSFCFKKGSKKDHKKAQRGPPLSPLQFPPLFTSPGGALEVLHGAFMSPQGPLRVSPMSFFWLRGPSEALKKAFISCPF